MAGKYKTPTIKELKEIAGVRRRQVGKNVTLLQVSSLFHRPVSIYFTKLFLMVGISPNAVTLISYLFAIATGVLFIFGNYWYTLIGIAVYQLFLILDGSDGDMSRYLYGVNKNPRGGFLEDMGHSIIQPFIIICISFGVYNNTNSLLVGSLFNNSMLMLILGYIGSSLYLVLHVLDYYTESRASETSLEKATPAACPAPIQRISSAFGRFRGVVNKYTLADLLLLITAVSNTLWFYLIVWTLIHIPLVLINGISSYRLLPKPRFLNNKSD